MDDTKFYAEPFPQTPSETENKLIATEAAVENDTLRHTKEYRN
jgi:hypothetical protein